MDDEMELDDLVRERRAYRSFKDTQITDIQIEEMVDTLKMAPSCFNNQPWRFVFVRDDEKLEEMYGVMSETNKWTERSSMVIAVFSREEDDCQVKGRNYHQFDTGMAVGLLLLKATEMGLVAHPIAGYDEEATKEVLDIPDEYTVITLIIVGVHSETPNELMTDEQKDIEKKRPERMENEEFIYLNSYKED